MADPENKVSEDGVEELEEVDDTEKTTEESVNTPTSAELASQLMRSPQVLAALQDRLGSMVGNPSGYIQSLPKPVKRRLKALKKLQFEATKIEADFFKEVHELECKYATKYAPLLERRRNIVAAEIEPTDSDCDWPSEDEKEEELSVSKDELKNKAKIEEKTETENKKEETEQDNKGVPSFWLTIFKNVDMLSEMVQDHDEPIIQHIQDIQVKFTQTEPMGFTLEFFFEPNEYFSNSILTKQYIMRSEPDESDPFSFEGPEIIKCKGCTIDWKKGKNVTVKTIKKKQKHKGTGKARVVTKTVQNDSFFNFFNPPQVPEADEGDMDEDVEALLAADFEIGHFIRERIVPRAVLYFTGEALENDDDFDEEENEEEEGGEEEYDEEHDPDFNPASDQSKPAECKQQ